MVAQNIVLSVKDYEVLRNAHTLKQTLSFDTRTLGRHI
jgi:hypothetical protein